MTTYTAIPNTDIDQDSPITQPLMTLVRDNPIAIAEGATGAPITATGWHPYDGVLVGDGNDGLIYDHSVDGTVASVATPDFADGYEYLAVMEALESSVTAALLLQLYRETDAAYTTAFTSAATNSSAGGVTSGRFEIQLPRVSSYYHPAVYSISINGVTIEGGIGGVYDATLQTILRARILFASGSITAGKIYLMRRKEFQSA